MNDAISRLLRSGVLLSVAVMIAGTGLTFIHHPSYMTSRVDLQRLTDAHETYPHTVRAVFSDISARRGQAIVMLGLLLLIATPVARVALSIGAFAAERDRLYVAITTLVLLLLLMSFLIGAAER